MTGLNNTLVAAKTKLEKDLVAVRTEYTDIARELKLADERANKASHDAQHFEGTYISMPPLLKNLHTLAKLFIAEDKVILTKPLWAKLIGICRLWPFVLIFAQTT